ncbi:MAG TPA: hypothetical protein VFX74_01595, partial [Candidatus Limnocylindria bacterium]|nr:hypothetical protein [Candidatus Limnocylindria bacterium]
YAAWRASRGRSPAVVPLFWCACAVFLLILGVSREIDLANRIADEGRHIFRMEGWYPDRRPVQRAAILAILGTSGVVGTIGCALIIWRRWPQLLLGFVAVVLLGTFLAVRTVSLHDIDALLYRRSFEQVQYNAIFELGATAFVGLAALLASARRRQR